MTDPIRVLIADDHPLFRDGLTAMLQTGDDTELTGAATDGLQAVELALHSQPDVVVMDLHMPGMDGIEATRRIRAIEADQEAPRTPILALTANASAEDRDACLGAGMDGFLVKPLDRERLSAALAGGSGAALAA